MLVPALTANQQTEKQSQQLLSQTTPSCDDCPNIAIKLEYTDQSANKHRGWFIIIINIRPAVINSYQTRLFVAGMPQHCETVIYCK